MNKEKLNRYFWLNHEIERQEKRRERLQRQVDSGDLSSDVVSGSSAHFPYIETKFKITGVSTDMLDKISISINRNLDEAVKARDEIENYVNDIDDPQMRELLRSRFIDCQGWKDVGRDNYISPDHARKKIREFLKLIS